MLRLFSPLSMAVDGDCGACVVIWIIATFVNGTIFLYFSFPTFFCLFFNSHRFSLHSRCEETETKCCVCVYIIKWVLTKCFTITVNERKLDRSERERGARCVWISCVTQSSWGNLDFVFFTVLFSAGNVEWALMNRIYSKVTKTENNWAFSITDAAAAITTTSTVAAMNSRVWHCVVKMVQNFAYHWNNETTQKKKRNAEKKKKRKN